MYLPARNKTSWLWHLFNDYLIFYAFDEYMEIFLNWVFKLPILKKSSFPLKLLDSHIEKYSLHEEGD